MESRLHIPVSILLVENVIHFPKPPHYDSFMSSPLMAHYLGGAEQEQLNYFMSETPNNSKMLIVSTQNLI